jgi:hypothetical protein
MTRTTTITMVSVLRLGIFTDSLHDATRHRLLGITLRCDTSSAHMSGCATLPAPKRRLASPSERQRFDPDQTRPPPRREMRSGRVLVRRVRSASTVIGKDLPSSVDLNDAGRSSHRGPKPHERLTPPVLRACTLPVLVQERIGLRYEKGMGPRRVN